MIVHTRVSYDREMTNSVITYASRTVDATKNVDEAHSRFLSKVSGVKNDLLLSTFFVLKL